jgi:cytochrome c oxidase assembly factor CtaG
MEALVTSVFAYALWPLLTLAVAVLWVAAALDILRHKRRGTFTDKGLVGMAAVVSVVAVVAISSIFAVFAGPWSDAVSSASIDGARTDKPAGDVPDRAYIFSFGMENASYGPPLDGRD